MEGYYVGLDISMKTTDVCVMDAKGRIVREQQVASHPDDIVELLAEINYDIETVGLESGPISHWFTEKLRGYGLDARCLDARHLAGFLHLQINKTDKNDARGIAEAMRYGAGREVAIKSEEMRSLSTLLTSRRLMVRQRGQLMMTIRGMLKLHGIRLGALPKTVSVIPKIRQAIADLSPSVKEAVEVLLVDLKGKFERVKAFDKELRREVRERPAAQLLMTAQGIGPVTALQYLVEIGDPSRFRRSRSVGAYIGATPRQYSSGETRRQGRISKCGSKELRSLLVEAAIVLMSRTGRWSKLKAWGLKLQRKVGKKKAAVAVARKLSVIMHTMLVKNEPFRFGEAA